MLYSQQQYIRNSLHSLKQLTTQNNWDGLVVVVSESQIINFGSNIRNSNKSRGNQKRENLNRKSWPKLRLSQRNRQLQKLRINFLRNLKNSLLKNLRSNLLKNLRNNLLRNLGTNHLQNLRSNLLKNMRKNHLKNLRKKLPKNLRNNLLRNRTNRLQRKWVLSSH